MALQQSRGVKLAPAVPVRPSEVAVTLTWTVWPGVARPMMRSR